MQPSGALVRSGIGQMEKQKEAPPPVAKPAYVGGLKMAPGQMHGKGGADDNDMVEPEDEDSFGDDASAEDDQALQIAEQEQVNLKEDMAMKLLPPAT